MDDATTRCPDCGEVLPQGRLGGLCPRCIAAGLGGASYLSGPRADAELDLPSSPAAILPASSGGGDPLEVQDRIGEGGMGEVHAAKDRNIGRSVALKRMRPEWQRDPDAVARFVAEAQTTGQLEHPGIVPVHEVGTDASGQIYNTMRLLDGVTLAEILAQLHAQDAATIAAHPLSGLLTVFQKVCDAVAFAHARGVIHRDLKAIEHHGRPVRRGVGAGSGLGQGVADRPGRDLGRRIPGPGAA